MKVNKLLVVVDMQNDFVTGVLGTKETQAIVEPMKKFIDSFDGDVLYTQDTHFQEYLSTQEGKKLPVPHCIKNTEGWQIVSQFNPEWVIAKNTFGSMVLANIIQDAGYNEIHFVGVCTGICVISNAVIAKAIDPEVQVIIHKDLCACVTPQSHEAALKQMELLQMDIV